MLISMGCNSSGAKRLDRSIRTKWYDKIEMLLEKMPNYFSAILTTLNNDKFQWIYIIIGPQKWVEQGKYEKDIEKSFSYWKAGIQITKYSDKYFFFNKLDELFLTKKELVNME